MSVFIDTSYFYALLDEDDDNHRSAAEVWPRALDGEHLLTHSYVVVETSALVQRRLGMGATVRFHRELLPAATQLAVGSHVHARAVDRWLAAGSRALSLVDVTSFVVMADHGLTHALAFDADFGSAGFLRWR